MSKLIAINSSLLSMLAGYSGDFCERDRDGCVEGAGCFMGVNCTDVPAPGTGAVCRSCPLGLTGDGVTCQGKCFSASVLFLYHLTVNAVHCMTTVHDSLKIST